VKVRGNGFWEEELDLRIKGKGNGFEGLGGVWSLEICGYL
jgi:hypothetical protein